MEQGAGAPDDIFTVKFSLLSTVTSTGGGI